MRYLILITAALLAACTHPAVREFQTWSEQTKPLAESGQIKWSDYYKEAFKRISEVPNIPGKASAMERADMLITASVAYEGDKISKEDFDSIRRIAAAAEQKEAESSSAAGRAAFGQALKGYGEARYGSAATQRQMIPTTPAPIYQPPKQIQCSTYGNQTNCSEY
jgi:hypothetical protein